MKGALKMLEVVLAASILLIGLAVIFVPSYSNDISDAKQQGYDALDYLYSSGDLRRLAANENPEDIRNSLSGFIDYQYKGVFCTDICDNSGVPDDRDVVIIDYYLSGYAGPNNIVTNPKKMRLYIW